MAWTYEATKLGYGRMWRSATIRPDDLNETTTAANRIIAGEARYREVEAATGVPWFWIGAIHMRESSNNFEGVLHNGEHIIGTGRTTSLVPAGRGPFTSWAEAAIDALQLKNLDDVKDWTIEQMLFRGELFNGLGYVGKGVNSPYIWAGTSHQQAGKYVRDGVFDRSAWDTQLGIAAVLKRLAEMRPDISAAMRSDTVEVVTPLPVPAPAPGQPTQGLDLAALIQLLLPVLLPLLQNLVKPQGAGNPPPPPPPPPVPPPPPSNTTRPSVQLGIGGLIASLLAQFTGVMGGPVAAEPSTVGTLATVIPAAVAGFGLTGGWGAIASIGARLLSGIIGRFTQPRQ